jgi:CRP/FNR family transcriptional regulator, cyclic AMP receptor protein
MSQLGVAAQLKRAASHRFDPNKFLATADSGRTLEKYHEGAKIYVQNDDSDAVFYIRSGDVKLAVASSSREAVVAIMTNDQFFGTGCLAGRRKRAATATAIRDSVILRIPRDAFLNTMKKEPALSALFIESQLSHTIRVEADLVDQLVNSSEKRLARMLLLLAKCDKGGRPKPILAKISQEMLADMIGTTRSRISFFMNRFRKQGFISYNGRIEVHSSLLSMVRVDQPAVQKAKAKGRQ